GRDRALWTRERDNLESASAMMPLLFRMKRRRWLKNIRSRLQFRFADAGASRTEEGDDLRGTEQNPTDERDVTKPSCEIIELTAEDEHGASNCYGCQRDEASYWSGNGLLDLLKWGFPRQSPTSGRSKCGLCKGNRKKKSQGAGGQNRVSFNGHVSPSC